MGGILSQRIHLSNYHDAHFKYLTILFVNCTSIKLEKNKGQWMRVVGWLERGSLSEIWGHHVEEETSGDIKMNY